MPNPYLAAALREQQALRDSLPPTDPAGYEARKVADLKAAIDSRNEGRDESDLIVPEGKTKPALIKALEADDRNTPPTEET